LSQYTPSSSAGNTAVRRRKIACLSLGSNLGDRCLAIDRALERMQEEQILITARSAFYETEPQDVPNQPWFLNIAVACKTDCFPLQLLAKLRQIERELGRSRASTSVRRGPRLIDIDILLFDNLVMDTPRLTIPHPRMLERRFVLEPLLEIMPDARHPKTREPLQRYLKAVLHQKLKKLD
jgi:2-amino-4-hydroxy-6-hydroxymethyldihydropteridine diphosphokinase